MSMVLAPTAGPARAAHAGFQHRDSPGGGQTSKGDAAMQATQVAKIGRKRMEISSRRGFLRLIGGAGALGAAEAVATSAGSARKRRRNRCMGCVLEKAHCVNGKCVPRPQRAITCTRWILSGGPEQSAPIVVDDGLLVRVVGQPGEIIGDADQWVSSLSPVAFTAFVGDVLEVQAFDASPECRSLSPLWLHCATSGKKRQLFAGNSDGSAGKNRLLLVYC